MSFATRNCPTAPSAARRRSSLAARFSAGFTLIEVMIVVAIIGILAAIALPAYGEYVLRGKIAEATSTMSSLRIKMEQYYQDNRNYGTVSSACPTTAVPTTPPDTKYFTYTCAVGATNQTYTITVAGVAAQGTTGFGYTINESNTRATTGTGSWGKTSTTCWVTKKDGSC